MSDFDQIRQLIRLKRHESPPKDFVDGFLENFQDRQRSELLRQSAHGLLWERLRMYVNELMVPRWATAAAALIVSGGVAWLMVPRTGSPGAAGEGGGSNVAAAKAEGGDFAVESVRIIAVDEPEEDPGLLSEHFEGYEELRVLPTGHGTGIAVPVKLISRVEEKAEHK